MQEKRQNTYEINKHIEGENMRNPLFYSWCSTINFKSPNSQNVFNTENNTQTTSVIIKSW